MARNYNGLERQDRVISQFHRDARSRDTNSAVSEALRQGRKAKAIAKAKAIEVKSKPDFKFAPGTPAHLEYIKSLKK